MNETKAGGLSQPLVSIVLLNFNNWGDTIECLESLLRLDYRNFEIIVCDNSSTDLSVQHIAAWARGELCSANQHERVVGPRSVSNHQLPFFHIVDVLSRSARRESPLALISLLPTGKNGGFAFGNNVGVRYALSLDQVEYVWLLNNDTVVAPNALSALVARMRADKSIGICGSLLLDFTKPFGVQALGGADFTRWRARAKALVPSEFEGLEGKSLLDSIEQRMRYVVGASMLTSRRFLADVGLLSEAYFLYFEEIDWARRASGFRLGYCPESLVYHRLGSTTGESENSEFSAYHLYRSRVLFVAKFDRWALGFVYILGCIDALKAVFRGRTLRARGIVRGLFGFW